MSKPGTKQTPKKDAPRARVTRVITTREEQQDDDEQEEESLNGDDFVDPTEEALESVFTEARGHDGVEIRVYKLDPENRSGARAYAMSVSLADAEGGRLLDTLQRKWKGGEFELMARADGRIVKRAVINVLPPPEADVPSPIQQQEQVANIVKASMEPMLQVIAEMRNRPQFNFETLLTKGTQLLPLLMGMRQLIAPTSAPNAVTNPSDPMAMLMQMKQMKDTMDTMGFSDREPDGMDRLLTLFNTFKPTFEKALTMQQQRVNPRPPNAPVSAAGSPTLVSGVPTVSVLPPSHHAATAQIPDALMPFIPMLEQAAQRGETVEAVAERVLSAIPDDLVDPLGDALDDGSLLTALMQRPAFAGLTPWLNALAQNILAAISSEDESPDAEGELVSATGDAPDDTDGNT